MQHKETTQSACDKAIAIINKKGLKFRPMQRKNNHVNTKRGYVIGRTNLKTGLITIDIYTPKFRKPKAISSILSTLCHEIAHHQKKPYRQRYKGKFIIRQHYPEFYNQANKNLRILKQDKFLKQYFK